MYCKSSINGLQPFAVSGQCTHVVYEFSTLTKLGALAGKL